MARLTLTAIALTLMGAATTKIAVARPNIVVILADDMRIDSVSAMHEKLGLKTPAIDRLASEGMSFTDAHSTSAVCSPTRYSVLTGCYNWRSRLKRGIVGQWQPPMINGLAHAIREGRTTPCPRQVNDGWPTTIEQPLLKQFPRLAGP